LGEALGDLFAALILCGASKLRAPLQPEGGRIAHSTFAVVARLSERQRQRPRASARRVSSIGNKPSRWLELIVNYLYESLTAYDARRQQIRTRAEAEAIFDEVLALLKEVKVIAPKPLLILIEGARPGLLTFLSVLAEKLERIEVHRRVVTGSRTAVFNALAHV
jgi:hypothetical protein